MTRIRDFEGHFHPFFFFRRSHPFCSFHNLKFEQLFLKRANIVLLLEHFLNLNCYLHWLFGHAPVLQTVSCWHPWLFQWCNIV